MKTYESRWGFHPHNYETHLKLKALYKASFEAEYAWARFVRWDRKQEHNRQGPKPIFNDMFRMEDYRYDAIRVRQHNGEYVRPYGENGLTDLSIRKTYNTARFGQPTAEEVQEPPLSAERIDELYEQLTNTGDRKAG